jgi:subtilisin family serine protease
VLVDAGVHNQLQIWGQTRLILYLRGETDFSHAYSIPDKAARGQYVYDQILKTASLSEDLYQWLFSEGSHPRRLLTANAIAATVSKDQFEKVLNFPQVGRVGLNQYIEAIADGIEVVDWQPSSMWALLYRLPGPGVIEWNIIRIRADDTWTTFGVRGVGAKVGIIDTGVMFTHPALVDQYQGNLGGGNFQHDYNWFDFIAGQPAPYDDHGHGTFGAGIVVGNDGFANQIGVAPGAKWIAVKGLDAGGGTTEEDLHASLEWMVAPTDLAGNNPDPGMAPNVVLNMWRWAGCTNTFDGDLVALRAANILPVFAPGGEGPGCGLLAYPAANPNTISAGATDIFDVILGFSARGPSCVDGTLKPDLVAPGMDIRSSTNTGGYDVWSGTSFSTAHLAGAAALLFSADPGITIDELEQTLFDTAVCHNAQYYCSGDNSCPGPNNTYGHGRIDVFEAVLATIGISYDVPWLTAGPMAVELPPGGVITTSVIFDAAGMDPGMYQAGIAIQSNDPLAPYTTLPVSLTVYTPCEPVGDVSASFAPLDPVVGEAVTFTAGANGTQPITYSWRFDDGSTATGQQVMHGFDSAGTHVVGLRIENQCDLVVTEIEVTVTAGIWRTILPLVIR